MALEANQTIRWKERIGIMAVGHTFKQVEEFVFDYTLYPAVIALLGAVTGGLVMTVFSALLCYLYIRFYDWSQKDWLGLELAKEMRDGPAKRGRVARFMQRIVRKGDVAAFFALSCYTDPFVTTVYLRRGAEAYNGLSERDWKIFWASVLVANLWWTGIVTLAVEGVRLLLNWFGFI
ncbi:MAG: hypothetical protein AAB882_01690 [Patescibacteria group bacterium]